MPSFRIQIPDKGKRSFHFLSLFIFILNLLIFMRIIVGTVEYQRWVAIVGVIICISGILFLYVPQNRNPGLLQMLHFLLLTFTWIFLPAVLPAICLAVFTAMGYFAGRERWLLINKMGIRYPSLPSKNIPWHKVSVVVLKDLVLTINLKDNRYIQLIVPEHSINISDQAFMQTCENWIIASRQKD